jgi:hypothetical protein
MNLSTSWSVLSLCFILKPCLLGAYTFKIIMLS